MAKPVFKTVPFQIAVGIAFLTSVGMVLHYERVSQRSPLDRLGSLRLGEPLPGFEARDLAGTEVSLRSFIGRKVVLLEFWASRCGPCQRLMPELQMLHDAFKDRGLQIVSINRREPDLQIRRFIDSRKYTLRVIADEDGSLADKFGVTAIPTILVVDKLGALQWIQVGFDGYSKDLGKIIERLCEE